MPQKKKNKLLIDKFHNGTTCIYRGEEKIGVGIIEFDSDYDLCMKVEEDNRLFDVQYNESEDTLELTDFPIGSILLEDCDINTIRRYNRYVVYSKVRIKNVYLKDGSKLHVTPANTIVRR